MQALNVKSLEGYLSTLFNEEVEILRIGRLGEKLREVKRELKGFGYGVPYAIEFKIGNKIKRVVLETVKPGIFGHQHFSDRAKILLWQHSTFNKLPKHVRSLDVGAFTINGSMKSLGDCIEFFILTEMVEGTLYHKDLERIAFNGRITSLDVKRCIALSNYLAEIHAVKRNEPELYIRRIRELVGHGECIMGLTDSYPPGLSYVDEEMLCEIEKRCVEWRWKLKKKTYRLSQVHGDFHPWNVMFREDADFTVLDRSRGEWGEPADDLTAMSINYIFFSLQTYGKLSGPFEDLFRVFWINYIDKTKDEEIFEVVQPFYAWRGLVIASPIWYPTLPTEVRTKIFNFIMNVLETDVFDIKSVNNYLGESPL